jgi:hypothetical protein
MAKLLNTGKHVSLMIWGGNLSNNCPLKGTNSENLLKIRKPFLDKTAELKVDPFP